MAHILLVETPPDDESTILQEAARLGHQVTFFSSDIDYFRENGNLEAILRPLTREIIYTERGAYSYEAFERLVLAVHAKHPFDAVMCLHDVHIVVAAQVAERLSLPFLNAATARLARDKYSVREALARYKVHQPTFALARSEQELREAAKRLGYPLLVKPSDGMGSQNVSVFRSEEELNARLAAGSDVLPRNFDYGYLVHSNNRFVVERFMSGPIVGCDVFTRHGERVFLGVHEKRFFPPPSFAIAGSCFPCERFDTAAIRDYAFRVLDAVDFNHGAAHLEIMLTDKGPHLIELNPRLIGARVSDHIGMVFERSIHEDLIALHLGEPLTGLKAAKPRRFVASRWVVADRPGILQSIETPDTTAPHIHSFRLYKKPGDAVIPPRINHDRVARVLTLGATQEEAERLADSFVFNTRLHIQ
ncbi:MAG TPA: ATP-grasp domain-containing protein [Noviherbaspirillum sp.]|uniref:ATP-grasp domain-containing protein n=1 Tax=Noviherbaspirillum sp. TaxID=1926288 RepID=UPI002B476D48|nr:ATP-grasp domain-containing protein [Noviherbaspirillum sp.]HJV86504.1 ATP-grasp domain-containing protein [Noviherbaspirillum sp.]